MSGTPRPIELAVRALRPDERDWLAAQLTASWGDVMVVSCGRLRDASRLTAFVGLRGDLYVGAATVEVIGGECELVTLNAAPQREGIGSALLDATAAHAKACDCRRLYAVTTNDNVGAAAFYASRGLRLAALREGAIEEARRLKPAIPLHGANGVSIRDELEFELLFD